MFNANPFLFARSRSSTNVASRASGATLVETSKRLPSGQLFNRYFNSVQVLSGLNAVIFTATSTVSFPRSFSKTTPSWLMMKV